jgi:hypothetical protein
MESILAIIVMMVGLGLAVAALYLARPYLVAVGKTQAQIDTIAANLESLTTQWNEKAAAEERGKRVATHEDIENVLRELKLTTEVTKSIETQFASGEWDRQTRWNKRAEVYGRILEEAQALRGKILEAHYAEQDCDAKLIQPGERERYYGERHAQVVRLNRALSVGMLFANDAVRPAIFAMTESIGAAMDPTSGADAGLHSFDLATEALTERIAKQLGLAD